MKWDGGDGNMNGKAEVDERMRRRRVRTGIK